MVQAASCAAVRISAFIGSAFMEVKLIDSSSIDVGGVRLDTSQVDQLLHDLALVRNELTPEIPLDVRQVEGNVVQQHDPDFQIALNEERNILMAIRHRGMGWCVFTLSPARAASLRDFLAKRTKGVGSIDLIDAEPPPGHRPN